MQIKPPVVDRSKTFDNEDTFRRKQFAEALTKVVQHTREPLVISLEAEWGEGKTSFVYKWMNYLKDNTDKLSVLYIDAYQNDFQQDPFLLLASEIYSFATQALPASTQADKFKATAATVSKAIATGTGKTLFNLVTAGMGAEVEKLARNVVSEFDTLSENAIEAELESYQSKKQSVQNLRNRLTDLVAELSGDKAKPLIIIIDELDRCRPSFALELLEATKHLFNAEGVVFVMVNNPDQMKESVSAQYGVGVKAGGYLRKFYDLSMTLPRADHVSISDCYLENFIAETILHYRPDGDAYKRLWGSFLFIIIKRHQLTLRDIQKLVLTLLIGSEMRNSVLFREANQSEQCLKIGLAMMALDNKKMLYDIALGNIDKNVISSFLKLEFLDHDRWKIANDDHLFDFTWWSFIDDDFTYAGQEPEFTMVSEYTNHKNALVELANNLLMFNL